MPEFNWKKKLQFLLVDFNHFMMATKKFFKPL